MITVIGIFSDTELAEQASSYLLANEFKSEDVDTHTQGDDVPETDRIGAFFSHLFNDEEKAGHYASLGRSGSIVTVHAASVREAQEAVDVFNNHGAIEVDLDENRSLVIEQPVEQNLRLRD
ncbi:hypothetical protein [Mucilaginibacter sp. UR6-11]|uniref:hypothetical protein n=1 Tax=Mucilaginibacter sp. UR6-11 TaxID=1435644 RepID=UPI001E4EF9C4|nr:hypothetical protein [Mucilaginibacter sp. UR6-11]MCC8426314.1 hypothetical protein [Mucilaginibacter sp. UR6-11]